MRKIVLLAALLCSISFSEGRWWTLRLLFPIDQKTGNRIFDRDMSDVEFNGERIAQIKTGKGTHFASSFRDGQATFAVDMHRYGDEPYTMMYTIDAKSKAVVKEERLNAIRAFKDSELEFSIIGDLKDTAVMQYAWKGERHKATLPGRIGEYNVIQIIYDGSGNGYMVFEVGNLTFRDNGSFDLTLYVFSLDKKKLTWLGDVEISFFTRSPSGFSVPLDEYMIYYPRKKSAGQVFLYRYAEEALYITRYQKIDKKTRDTIFSNLKNGNTYEQFLPLTKVENMDSLVRYFLCSKHTIYHDCRLDGGAF